MELTIWLAFIAGLVSFISPCVLPLVPAYIGYMGGRVTHTVAVSASASGSGQATAPMLGRRLSTVSHGLAFVAGFTTVFVLIGLLSTAFLNIIGGQNINTVTNIIGRIGGLVIIFFGLHFMGVMPAFFKRLRQNEQVTGSPLTSLLFAAAGVLLIIWGFSGSFSRFTTDLSALIAGEQVDLAWLPILTVIALIAFILWLVAANAFTRPQRFWTNLVDRLQTALYADTRHQMDNPGQQGYAGSALMGVVFSAGWTPCIGPVYGAVLTMAANGGNVGEAGILLLVYSLGLGVPFLLTAFLLDGAQSILWRLQRHMRKIELASGAFLVVIGILVASGSLQQLSVQFGNQFADFSYNLEESVLNFFTGTTEEPEEAETSSNLIITNPETTLTQPETEAGAGAISSITGLAENSGPPTGLSIGSIAPDFETITDTGQPIRLSDLRGQIVLVNFWATWCGPCRIEMPEFETVYNAQRDNGFTILAVNNAEPVAAVQSFREEIGGLSFPIAMDENGAIQNQYNIFSYPSTFLLDADGVIIERHFGPLTAEQIQEMVTSALAS